MNVKLTMAIGKGEVEEPRLATKMIELDFTPAVGMGYLDGTWQVDRKIEFVSIENLSGDPARLVVSLGVDETGSVEQLRATYEEWGWKISRS